MCRPSEFVARPHPQFVVNDELLTDLLERWYPGHGFAGLIPTTLNWLISDAEQSVVWERFLRRTDGGLVVPLLCCPDDLDFSCSLVVAETRFVDDVAEWLAFGFDQTRFDRLPGGVGSNATWFPIVTPLRFARTEFDAVTAQFQEWVRQEA